MKKILSIAMWILTMVLLAGCSKFEPEGDAVSIDKKGKIVRVFMDEFVDASNQPYDMEEIQDMMEKELKAYNNKFGLDHILLKECELEEGILTIQIECDEAKYYEDYCSYYNDDFTTEEDDVEFYVGTVGSASEYDFAVSFVNAEGTAVDASEVLADAKHKAVILNEPIEVYTSGKILYASDNVEILGKKQAKVLSDESGQLKRAYIIYK